MPYSTYQIFLNIYNESKKRKEVIEVIEVDKVKRPTLPTRHQPSKSLLINNNILPISD